MKWYAGLMEKVLANKLSAVLAVSGAVLCIGSVSALGQELWMKQASNAFYDNTYDAIMSRESAYDDKEAVKADAFSGGGQIEVPDGVQMEASGGDDYGSDFDLSECDDYLFINGTSICYPLNQGEDNSYYLNHLPNGTPSKYGSIFVDYQNSDHDFNTIIYGHNMKDGRMFGGLSNYYTVDSYAQEHADLVINRNGVRKEYELCSVQKVQYDSEVYRIEPPDKELWVNHLLENSVVDLGVELSGQDRFVTLSTCGGGKTEKVVTVWREL